MGFCSVPPGISISVTVQGRTTVQVLPLRAQMVKYVLFAVLQNPEL